MHNSFLKITINELLERKLISIKIFNALYGRNIQTVCDLVKRNPKDLLKTTNFGKKSLSELETLLSQNGLRLDMTNKEIQDYEILVQTLSMKTEDLNLPVMTGNILLKAGLSHVWHLVQYTDEGLLKFRTFGQDSLKKTKEALAEVGLHLGMDVRHYPNPKKPRVD